jgi:hypothetical protein
LRVEFCTGGCEDRTLAREDEESTLLGAVARERLMKDRRLEEGSEGAMVICKVCRLAIAL